MCKTYSGLVSVIIIIIIIIIIKLVIYYTPNIVYSYAVTNQRRGKKLKGKPA